MGKWIKNPANRKYVYGVGAAFLPILVIMGIVSENDIPLYLTALGALLGLGMANVNTDPNQEK